ncbi:MAG: PIN domain nuclease [Fimbriimonadales bacterium]|nr:MAG: PIN domain nuclease [Fimbriimonadales bacterium]
MKYLLDSNILLEGLLLQARADEVRALLLQAPSNTLCLSDFSLHSIGLILTRANLHHVFLEFVEDMLLSGYLHLVSVPPRVMLDLVKYQIQFNLDFDDAYQYTVAVLNQLDIVSFDADFDRTDKGRKTPEAVLDELSEVL